MTHLSRASFELYIEVDQIFEKKIAIMQSSPTTSHISNFSIFGPVSPEIIRPHHAIFGGSHLSRAVLVILYQVLHSFYRVSGLCDRDKKYKA